MLPLLWKKTLNFAIFVALAYYIDIFTHVLLVFILKKLKLVFTLITDTA